MTYDILTQLAAATLNPMGNLQRSMASAPEPKRFQARPQHLDSKAASPSSKKGSWSSGKFSATENTMFGNDTALPKTNSKILKAPAK